MSQETIDDKRREQKIYQELVNLSEEENDKDLYKEMDTLREDLEHNINSEFFGKLEEMDNDSNNEEPANSEEPLMNTEPSENHISEDITQESDAQSKSVENSEPCDEMQSEKGIVAKNWLLVAGLVFVAIGMFGVIGLRLNIVQIFLLSIDDPFPGIGSMEPMGHIGSIIPFAIGIVAIFVWGFRSDQGEAEEDSDGEDNEVKKIETLILEPRD